MSIIDEFFRRLLNPPISTFMQLEDEATVIDMEGQHFGEGAYGKISGLFALSFSNEKTEPAQITRHLYAAKKDRNPSHLKTQKEYFNQKNLWDRLNEEERPFMLPPIGYCSGALITEFYSHDLNGAFRLPTEAKTKIAQSILTSAYLILKNRFVLPDIKEGNMLFMNGTYHAVLSDYCGLTSLENLDIPKLNTLYTNIKIWSPEHLPIEEYIQMRTLLEKIIKTFDQLSDYHKESVELLLQRDLNVLQQFAVGSVLYRLFTNRFPYPLIRCSTLPESPQNFSNHSSQVILPSTKSAALKRSGCPPYLRKAILTLTQPNKQNRYVIDDLTTLINSFNLLKL